MKSTVHNFTWDTLPRITLSSIRDSVLQRLHCTSAACHAVTTLSADHYNADSQHGKSLFADFAVPHCTVPISANS